MSGEIDRRGFLAGTLATSVLAGACLGQAATPKRKGPIAISSDNGMQAVTKAVEWMKLGRDPLDAAIAGVNLVEDDPNDDTVGLGGLPNEDGIVELDAAVMHGPSARGGAVGALRNIRNPSKVAKLVMERTDHCLIVGDGALRFAKAHGFKEENLLTESSRKKWLDWKENLSTEDDWIGSPAAGRKVAAITRRSERQTGTIHLSALDANGDLSCCTTTSGLAFKLAGRMGDSPILGAGLYTDNEVGSAGSTGRGEANLLACSSIFIVESMRHGMTPEEACLAACKRIARLTKDPRLLSAPGHPNFNVKFYAIDKQGRFGSAAIYKGAKFSFHDGTSAKLLDSAYLFEKKKIG